MPIREVDVTTVHDYGFLLIDEIKKRTFSLSANVGVFSKFHIAFCAKDEEASVAKWLHTSRCKPIHPYITCPFISIDDYIAKILK